MCVAFPLNLFDASPWRTSWNCHQRLDLSMTLITHFFPVFWVLQGSAHRHRIPYLSAKDDSTKVHSIHRIKIDRMLYKAFYHHHQILFSKSWGVFYHPLNEFKAPIKIDNMIYRACLNIINFFQKIVGFFLLTIHSMRFANEILRSVALYGVSTSQWRATPLAWPLPWLLGDRRSPPTQPTPVKNSDLADPTRPLDSGCHITIAYLSGFQPPCLDRISFSIIYAQHLFSRSDSDEHGSLLPKHQSTLSDDTMRSFFLFIIQTGCQTRGPTIRTHNILVLQIEIFLILTDFLRFLWFTNIKPNIKHLRNSISPHNINLFWPCLLLLLWFHFVTAFWGKLYYIFLPHFSMCLSSVRFSPHPHLNLHPRGTAVFSHLGDGETREGWEHIVGG